MGLVLADDLLGRGLQRVRQEVDDAFDAFLPVPEDSRASLVEAMRQLMAQPLGTAVPGAKTGLVSGFGMINYDRGLSSCAAVLARAA